jgi:phosphinothricin acetyltransferase
VGPDNVVMDNELVVRAAAWGDLESVAEIYAHYVEHSVVTFDLVPPTAEAWRLRLAELEGAGWPFLVGVVGDEVVGFGYVAPWRSRPAYRHTVENSIYLAPDRTGRGFGGRLLDELLLAAAASGAREVVAMVTDSGSAASMALHRRAGFDLVGRLREVGYKHDRWIDVNILQASLHGPS